MNRLFAFVMLLGSVLMVGCCHRAPLPSQVAQTTQPAAPREGKVAIPMRDPAGTLLVEQVEVQQDGANYSAVQWSFIPAQKPGAASQPAQMLDQQVTAEPDVRQVLQSPDERYLAVVSAGSEGDMLLEVLDLQLLIRQKKVQQLVLIDPFPNGVAISNWTQGRLLLRSHSLLTHRDAEGHVPAALTFADPQTFSWNPADGKLDAVSKDAQEPEAYFTKQLTGPFLDYRDAAIAAVKILKAKQALPQLRKMLAAAKSPDEKKSIETAIGVIEGRATTQP